jgi:hypothetical protein
MVVGTRHSVTLYARCLACSVSPRHFHSTNASCSFIHLLRCIILTGIITIIIIIIIIIIIAIKWPYNPVRTFACLVDFSQSSLVFDISFQFLVLRQATSVCT